MANNKNKKLTKKQKKIMRGLYIMSITYIVSVILNLVLKPKGDYSDLINILCCIPNFITLLRGLGLIKTFNAFNVTLVFRIIQIAYGLLMYADINFYKMYAVLLIVDLLYTAMVYSDTVKYEYVIRE